METNELFTIANELKEEIDRDDATTKAYVPVREQVTVTLENDKELEFAMVVALRNSMG